MFHQVRILQTLRPRPTNLCYDVHQRALQTGRIKARRVDHEMVMRLSAQSGFGVLQKVHNSFCFRRWGSLCTYHGSALQCRTSGFFFVRDRTLRICIHSIGVVTGTLQNYIYFVRIPQAPIATPSDVCTVWLMRFLFWRYICCLEV